jgi:hypothetical protein
MGTFPATLGLFPGQYLETDSSFAGQMVIFLARHAIDFGKAIYTFAGQSPLQREAGADRYM